MSVIVHDPGVTELELTNRVVLEPAKNYVLQIKETLIKRLPEPFPSRCVSNMPHVIFEGECVSDLGNLGNLGPLNP